MNGVLDICMSVFTPQQLNVLVEAQENWNDPNFSVDSAKNIVKEIALRWYPNDQVHTVQMGLLTDGAYYSMRRENGQTYMLFVVENTGKVTAVRMLVPQFLVGGQSCSEFVKGLQKAHTACALLLPKPMFGRG
jgi:hypothetical protein